MWGLLFSNVQNVLLVIVALAGGFVTYQVEEWRWHAKETSYLQAQAKMIAAEQKKSAAAATKFEKQVEKTNEIYRQITRDLNRNQNPAVTCLDPKRLRTVNSALARKAPDPSGLNDGVPQP